MSKSKGGRHELEHHYRRLGLKPGAKEQAIRDAYKQLAKKYHPDRNPGNPEALQEFLAIKKAYDALIERKTSSKVISRVEEQAYELKRSRRARNVALIVGAVVAVLGGGALGWMELNGQLPYIRARNAQLNGWGEYEPPIPVSLYAGRTGYTLAIEQIEYARSRTHIDGRKKLMARFHAATLVRRGDLDEALACLNEHLQSFPDDALALTLVGDVQTLLHHHDAAVKAYEMAHQLSDDREITGRRAAGLLRLGEVEQAAPLLDELEAGDDDLATWATVLRLLREERYAEAAALETGSSFVEQGNRGLAQVLAGDPVTARITLEAAASEARTDDFSGEQFGTLYQHPRLDGMEVLPRLGAEVQRSAILVNLGLALAAAESPRAALGPYEQAEVLDRDWAVLQFAIGAVQLTQAEGGSKREAYQKAAVRFKDAARLDPELLVADLRYARAAVGAGQEKEALAHVDALVKEHPANPLVHLGRAEVYGMVGNLRAEEAGYRRVLRMNSRLGLAHLYLSDNLFERGRYRESMRQLELATRDQDYARQAWDVMATRAYEREDCGRALRAFRKLVAGPSPDPARFIQMACCQSRLGQTRASFESLVKAARAGFREYRLLDVEPCLERTRKAYPSQRLSELVLREQL